MIMKVQGESPFQIFLHSFCVSPSAEGYVLNYSADGYSYTAWEDPVPADEVLVVNGSPEGMYFKLMGNNSILTIQG